MISDKSAGLRRVIALPHATAMVVGTIIGASIFVQPSEITARVPNPLFILLVWILSGVITCFGALVCAELASIFPKTGGVYVYLMEAYSPSIGFLWGWAMFWSMHSGIIAAISVICARYVAYFYPMNSIGITTIAILVITVISAINYIGVKEGSTLQTLFTGGKLSAIALLIIIGLAFGSRIPEHFISRSFENSHLSIKDFLLALVAGLFTFGGWHMVTYSAEETINPRKTIPRALIIGMIIVTVCYLALNTVYMYILPLDVLASSTKIAADAADALFGGGGGGLMAGLVIFSSIGSLFGIILAGPRVYYIMAQEGLLFRWIGEIHPHYRTPSKAIILQAIWSSVLVATGTYRELFTRVVYTEWIFFGLMALGIFILRRRPGMVITHNISGYPYIPALFIISSFAIVINQIISDPLESLYGLSIILIGLPVYYLWVKKRIGRSELNVYN